MDSCECAPWNLIHLQYEVDPGETKNNEGAKHEVDEAKEDKLCDHYQRDRERW